MSAFIDAHRQTFGVAPICRVPIQHGVPIAPETHYARRRRPPSTRAGRDEQVPAEIIRMYTLARGGLNRARKVYHQLRREGVLGAGTPTARCTVERLMRTHGPVGVRRVRTTLPDSTAARPADLVRRQFTGTAPNQLWVADLQCRRRHWKSYALGIGLHACRDVVGVHLRLRDRCVLADERGLAGGPDDEDRPAADALDMASLHRVRAGHEVAGLVHHSPMPGRR